MQKISLLLALLAIPIVLLSHSIYAQTSQNTLGTSLTLQDQSSCSTIQGNWVSNTCTITGNLAINPSGSLTINSGITIYISSNGTISDQGNIINYGTISNSGTIIVYEGYRLVNYGSINNIGTVNNHLGSIQDHCIGIFTGNPATPTPVQTTPCPLTTTTVSVLHNPSISGQLVTFTAAVTTMFHDTTIPLGPTGTVQFNDTSTSPPNILGTSLVSPTGNDQVVGNIATFSTSSLSVGTHYIVAKYLGDPNYSNSVSNTIVQVVSNPVTANSSNNSVNENTSLQITLTGNDLLGKQITFSIAKNPLEGKLSELNPTTGLVIYTPNRDYVGKDSFTFTASDGSFQSNTASFNVTIASVSYTPTAIVGVSQTVNAASTVTLNGTASIDPYYNMIMKYYPNGQIQPISDYLKYSWSQTSGIPVTLSNPSSSNPSFTAPSSSTGIILSFTLTVSDKGSNTSSPVTIAVKPLPSSTPMTQSTSHNTSQNSEQIQQSTSNISNPTSSSPSVNSSLNAQVTRPSTNQSSTTSPLQLPTQNISSIAQNSTNQTISITQTSQITKSSTLIPKWIHNNAKWWADGTVGDNDFTQGIQYLIQQKIINIPEQNQTTAVAQKVPAWVKNTAGWWANGKMSDDDFLKGIEYLVRIGIIRV